MKAINKGNENVVQTIRTKKIIDKQYRLSDFSYVFADNGVNIITNTMSGEVYELNDKEYEAVLKIKKEPVGTGFICDNGLEQLVYNRMLVTVDFDDKAKYQSTLQIMKIMKKQKKGIKTYTILPTTGCNARCVYCYEKDYKIKNMTPEIADRVIEYIAETKSEGEIKLRWFGGEPLVGRKMISYICAGLKARNIEYRSSMISNGALFDKSVIDEAVNNWKLKKIQIALDGDRNEYEKRKQYINPEKDNYDKVLDNVKMLSESGIKVILRCNYDKENFSGLKKMVDDLAERFAGIENISIYFHILFQHNDSEDFVEQITMIDEIYDYAKEKGLNVGTKKPGSLKLNCCMADNMDGSVVIDPEGLFYNCEHMPETGTWGNIFDGITDRKRYDELKAVKPIEKECEHCCFLPKCTSFYKKGCPNLHKNCYEERKADLERQLRSLINDLKEKGEL